jgi:hypothetical protein
MGVLLNLVSPRRDQCILALMPSRLIAFVLFGATLVQAGAVVVGPYTSDEDTVYLYHLDEVTGASSAANSGTTSRPLISFNGASVPSNNNSSQPTITTILGAAGAGGFGNSAVISSATVGLGLDGNGSGGFQPGTTNDASGNSNGPDTISQSSIADASGSFTVEALVSLSSITGANREIICTDSSSLNRGFQFRIGTSGALEFNFIANSGVASVAIPTSGVHAFVANDWFHVALSYEGSTHTSSFYWTRLSSSATSANLLGTSTVASTTGSVTGPLVIGNEGRGASGEGFQGSIDEVRVSKVARAADQFIFVNDDTDGDGLADSWEMLYFNSLGQGAGDDPDGDSYTNAQEQSAGTMPNNALSNPGDSDVDGLPDSWEITHFGSIAAQNGSGDPDGDFATNLQEHQGGTDPKATLSFPDADQDGLNDGWEIHYFQDLSHDGSGDSDSDGSTDGQEHAANSDPNNPLWSATQASLVRRWDFNNNLTDSIVGAVATIVEPDSNTAVGGQGELLSNDVLLRGGARNTSAYIQLGSGGLLAGRRTPVTIELWATQVEVQSWARIFDFGSSTTDFLFMSWTRGTTLTQDRVQWLDGQASIGDDKVAPYAKGTSYHIVMTIEPRIGTGGTTRVTWFVAPAGSSALGFAKWTFDTTNTMVDLNDAFNYLGRSQFAADNTANARYDEFRLWNGVLSSTAMENNQITGPDVISNQDSDDDGLSDAWEMFYFGNLDALAEGDADGDQYTNHSEYLAHSNPTLAASTPADLDSDGLADLWEVKYFGNVAQGASADPDADGESNSVEQANGSAPTNKASDSTDTDGDGLPDVWEHNYFQGLSYNSGSDPDADGFGNLQESLAGTNPAVASSRPAGTAVKLVPLDDGDHATSEFGYAGSSAINSVAFVRSSIKTVGDQQFITWYGRHQYNSAALYNNTIWIGRRNLGSSEWEVFRHPTFTANSITDGHDVISYGIDGAGYMHVSWGMHGDAFHYSKSTTPVTGNGAITLGPDTTMTGTESSVTYPQFLKLPAGDLLFIFREVASGNGDTYINRYSIGSQTWANVHGGTSTQSPFIKGTGWTPNYNAYLNMPQLGGADGNELILTWCWRTSSGLSDAGTGFSGYQTNNNLNFARSLDSGLTWKRNDGTSYALPITRDLEIGAANKAEILVTIPEGSSLINQASTCLDSNDKPVTCTWWAPESSSGNQRRQYRVVYYDDNGTPVTADDSWQTRTVSNRTSDPVGTRYAEDHVRDLGRPIVVADDQDRLIVAYRDNQSTTSLTSALNNGITIVHSLPKSADPNRLVWLQFDLTLENLGNYEPIIDNELWDRERQLHFLYQAAEGQGYTAPANLASRFSVLEWDAASYFSHQPQPSVAFSADKTQITITCPSQPSWGYRLWSSVNLEDWVQVETRSGTGLPLEFTQLANAGEARKYWRIEFKEGGF